VLRKVRAHFEIHLLSASDEESNQYPEEILTMSARFLDLLSTLITDVEDARNTGKQTKYEGCMNVSHGQKGVPDSTRTIVSPFMHGYTCTEEDFYVLLVQSDLLFQDLPSEQQASSIVPSRKVG
jgi:hypothetical protein